MAKVARMAPAIPEEPVCVYAPISAVVAPAATAAALSKPQIGAMFTPFALELIKAETKRTKTHVTRRELRIV